MADDFPEEVRRFILETINSVEQLEVLLLLRREAEQDWSAAAVGQALSTSTAAAGMRLTDLTSRGFLAATSAGSETTYRYASVAPERERLVDLLATTYAERRVAVISLIYSKPNDQVRAFADAFRLRKDK
jgi:hypothetical protein